MRHMFKVFYIFLILRATCFPGLPPILRMRQSVSPQPPTASRVQWLTLDASTNLTTKYGPDASIDGSYAITQVNHQAALPALFLEIANDNTTPAYAQLAASKPKYIAYGTQPGIDEQEVTWDGSDWYITLNVWYQSTNTSTTTFPPTADWTEADPGSGVPLLFYDYLWVSSGEFSTIPYADLAAHTNGLGNVVVVRNASSEVTDIVTYALGFTPSGWENITRWLESEGDTGASATIITDVEGNPVVDDYGFVTFDE